MHLRNAIAISVISFSTTLFAATEFPNGLVPSDIVNEFVSGEIYNGLPDNFPVPILPAGTPLYVLASVDNGYGQELLLGTTLTGAQVRDLMKEGYAPSGWVDLSRSPNILQLCHDTLGSLTFQMRSSVGAENRINVQRSPRFFLSEPDSTCAQQLDYLNGGPARSASQVFRESIPELDLPPGTVNPGPLFPGGLSSGGSVGSLYMQSRTERSMEIPDYSLAELQDFIAQQMTADGWQLDGDFVGTKSASSLWFKTVRVPSEEVVVPAGIALVLTADLTLLNKVEDAYSLSLIVTHGDPSGGSIGIRGVSPF
jgi:hypothetical protein